MGAEVGWCEVVCSGAGMDGLKHFASLYALHWSLGGGADLSVVVWVVVGLEVTQSVVLEPCGVFDASLGEQFATCVVREIW